MPKEVLGGVKVFEFSFEENLLCVVQECVPLAVGAINPGRQTGGLVRCSSGTGAAALTWSPELLPGGKMETERGDEQQHTDSGSSPRPAPQIISPPIRDQRAYHD